MTFNRKLAGSTSITLIASVWASVLPASAVEVCMGEVVQVNGTDRSDLIVVDSYGVTVRPNHMEAYHINLGHVSSVVINTGQGNDRIVVKDNIELIACFDDEPGAGNDRVEKQDGDATVLFEGDAVFTATGGNNRVHVERDGEITTGSGDDDIFVEKDGFIDAGDGNNYVYVEMDGFIVTGDGNDDITVELDGEIDSGGGNDQIRVYGQAIVDAGSGADYIQTGPFNDWIVSGPGKDVVDAGDGYDRCDWNIHNRPTKGDRFSSCESIF